MRDNSSRTARRSTATRSRRTAWIIGALLAAAAGLGCEEDKPEAAPTATADAAKQEVAPSGPIEALTAPDGVIVYGGVEDAAGLTEKLKKAYPALGPSLDAKALTAAFAQRYKLSDASVVEAQKPIRFAVIDPKKSDDPMVLIVPTKGREAFEKALPKDAKKDDKGNTWSLGAGGRTSYVNVIDSWAVFAGSPDVFKNHKDFLVKLTGAKLSQPAMLVVDAAHTMKIFGDDVEKGLAGLEEQMKGQPGMSPGSMAGMGKLFRGFVDVAKEAEKVVIVLAPLDDGALLKTDVHPKKNSDLAKAFESLGEEKLDLLAKAPKDAPLVAAWSMNPDKATDLTKALWRWSLQFMGTEETDPKYTEAMEAYWKATDGDVLAVAHDIEGKEGLRFSMIFGVRDAEKAREAQMTLRGLYEEPAIKERYKEMGITMTHKPDAYKVGDVSVSTVTTDLKKDGGLDALGPGGSLFSNMLTQHFAVGEKLGVVGYGPNGKDAVQAWLEGKIDGGFDGTPAAKKAVEYAAPGTFFLIYGQAGPLAKTFTEEKVAPADPQKRGLVLSAGAKGGVLQIVADVPQEQVTAIQQAIGGLGASL